MMKLITKVSVKSMFIHAIEEQYRWLARQRPNNKRQNRILLLNAKKRTLPRTEKPTDVIDDLNKIPRKEVFVNGYTN